MKHKKNLLCLISATGGNTKNYMIPQSFNTREQTTITNGLTRDAEFEHLLKTESTADFVGKRVN